MSTLILIVVWLGVLIERLISEAKSGYNFLRISLCTALFITLAHIFLLLTGIGEPEFLKSLNPYLYVTQEPGFKTLILTSLVLFLGVVLVRYAWYSLSGDLDRRRFIRSLMLTLATTLVVIGADNLILMAFAWFVCSLSLQKLITFYSNRPATLRAARQKYWMSRSAEILIACSIFSMHFDVPSVTISEANDYALNGGDSYSFQLSLFLMFLAISIKTAQIPFHGWLIKIVEAPTPVSALLHAGVVNIGGILILLLAPAFSSIPWLMLCILIVGLITSIISGLAASVQTTVKAKLAWSTSSQMGFMFVECGLGLFNLVLLHIAAHSLYKAYSFLSAGSPEAAKKVRPCYREGDLLKNVNPVTLEFVFLAMAVLIVFSLITAINYVYVLIPVSLFSFTLLVLSLTSFARSFEARESVRIFYSITFGLFLILGYALLYRFTYRMVPQEEFFHPAFQYIAAIGLVSLFALQVTCEHALYSKKLVSLRRLAQRGFFIDDVKQVLLSRLISFICEPYMNKRLR